jgi:hypothetical protein
MHYARHKEAIPMTGLQIDTSRVPLQNWAIPVPAFLQTGPASPTLAAVKPTPMGSLRASDAVTLPPPPSLDVQLFDNGAQLKLFFSQIAMHLTTEWRTTIFEQLDFLLNSEDWQEDSALIEVSTFITFLRFLIFAVPNRLPSLGISPNGNVLAAWLKGDERITVQFLPDDRAIATLLGKGTRANETVVWRGHVVDLKLFIDRFGVRDCMIDGYT